MTSFYRSAIICVLVALSSCGPREFDDSDRRELVRRTLEIALTEKKMPSYRLLKDTAHIVVSTENIRADWLPSISQTTLIGITLDSIQSLANLDPDFYFLYFDPIELADNGDAVVSIRLVWAINRPALNLKRRDQYVTKLRLTFYRYQNSWKARPERVITIG